MTNIKEFIGLVGNARKRTGVVWLSGPELLRNLSDCGVEIINLGHYDTQNIIITDDELISLIFSLSKGKSAALLNMEIFLGPRYKDVRYIHTLLAKIIVKEPLKPVFFIFYSDILYEIFRDYYCSLAFTQEHYFEETLL